MSCFKKLNEGTVAMKRITYKQVLAAILILITVCSGLSIAQKKPKDHFDFPRLNSIQLPEVKQKTLDNGIRLFLVEDHDFPTINIRAMIRTGSACEPADKVGLADITADVLRTGGTSSMTGDEIDQTLETMAASIEGGMGATSGFLTASMLREDLDAVLAILKEMLLEPVFAEEKIDLAKVQQKTAISRRNDAVNQIANREFNKLVYGADSPYARHPEYATIDAITRDDIVSFYKRFMHPENIIMAVWGDFSANQMMEKLETLFGGWTSHAPDSPSIPEVAVQNSYTVNLIDKQDVNQSNILVGHLGGLKSNADYPALSVMNRILSFDRMFKIIRTDEGLAYTVWGNYGTGYDIPGIFSAGAQTKSQSTVYAIEIMLREMKRIMTEEVTDKELEGAKDQILNSYVFNFDSKAKIVNRMMTLAYHDYPADFSDQFIKQVEDVNKADILRVAKQYLEPDAVHILVVGKKEDFDKPLSTLGDVRTIDISIPVPKQEDAPEATAESLTRGKALLDKAASACGGLDVLKTIRNMKTKLKLTQVTPMGDMDMAGEIVIVYPDQMRGVISTPMGDMIMVLKGTDGWMSMTGRGTMPLPDNQRQMYTESFLRDPVIFFTQADQAQYIGQRQLEGVETEEILITVKDYTFRLLLNPATDLPAGLIYTSVTPQGPAEMVDVFSDYQETNGYRMPTRTISWANGERASETVVETVELNITVDPLWFEKE